MFYSDFTLSSVKKQFNLNLREKYGLFEEIKSLQPQQLLTEILRDNIPLALASNTEKSRSEMIITPVLIEVRKELERKITIFSGVIVIPIKIRTVVKNHNIATIFHCRGERPFTPTIILFSF